MIEAMVSSGKISLEDAGLVDVEKIYMFINSSIGKRMKRAWEAGMLFREKQFVMGIDSSLYLKILTVMKQFLFRVLSMRCSKKGEKL